jgi:type I restriction enzyme M protein
LLKLNKPLYVRDLETGEPERDEENQVRLLTDLPDYLEDLRRSPVVKDFPWLVEGVTLAPSARVGHAVPIKRVTRDPHLTMDAKRFSPKYLSLVDEIKSGPHFRLGDVVDFVPEARETSLTKTGRTREVRKKFSRKKLYRYVDIEAISDAGTYSPEELRGWQLPERARHVAQSGDLFIASIWSSVRKWALVGNDDQDLLFTNGCHQVRLKAGCEEFLLDVVAGLARGSYAVQMRALARGSDGLAEINEADASEVLFARVSDPVGREQLQAEVDRLMLGHVSIRNVVREFQTREEGAFAEPQPRVHHASLV